MQLHELVRNNPNKRGKRVGRGGKRGKTSGRGTKGQKARSGHRIRPESRDALKKVPKLRGHGKNRAKGVNSSIIKPLVINLDTLMKAFPKGGDVNPGKLAEARIFSRKAGGRLRVIKILGNGDVGAVFNVSDCFISDSARGKIEKAGGKVSLKKHPNPTA